MQVAELVDGGLPGGMLGANLLYTAFYGIWRKMQMEAMKPASVIAPWHVSAIVSYRLRTHRLLRARRSPLRPTPLPSSALSRPKILPSLSLGAWSAGAKGRDPKPSSSRPSPTGTSSAPGRCAAQSTSWPPRTCAGCSSYRPSGRSNAHPAATGNWNWMMRCSRAAAEVLARALKDGRPVGAPTLPRPVEARRRRHFHRRAARHPHSGSPGA